MAKKAYIGVNGVARKVKKGYVGVVSDYTTGVSVAQSALSFGTCAGYTVANLNATAPIEWNEAAGKFQFTAGTATTTYASSTVWWNKISAVIGGSVAGCSWVISEEDPTVYWEYYSYGDYDDNFKKFYRKPGTTAVARKIKKAYIGVGGVARPCFGSDPIEYYGLVTGLSAKRCDLVGASNLNYAIFAGGFDPRSGYYGPTDIVNAYNKSLTRSGSTLSSKRRYLSGATADGTTGTVPDYKPYNYALFAGGKDDSDAYSKEADAYSDGFVKTDAPSLLSKRENIGSASVGPYAIFAGGDNYYSYFTDVDAYAANLTKVSISNLTDGVAKQSCGSFGGHHAIFAGGNNSSGFSKKVKAYDSSLTQLNLPDLPDGVGERGACAQAGDSLLLAGGAGTYGSVSTVYAYSASLARTTATALSVARSGLVGVTLNGLAMFAGGSNGSTAVSTVDIYDQSLTRQTALSLSGTRINFAGAVIGNYALFAGGVEGTSYTDKVEAFVAN